MIRNGEADRQGFFEQQGLFPRLPEADYFGDGMKLGAPDIQIFVGLAVVLAAAFVALLCDLLRSHSDRLLVRNVELRVRQEERERFGPAELAYWFQQLVDALRERRPGAAARVPAATAETGGTKTGGVPADGNGGPPPPATADAATPTGFQELGMLSRLMADAEPFRGVTVLIGIDDYERVKDKVAPGTGTLEASIRATIQSMLRPEDFAFRPADDEFILVYPGETGPAAQRRLYQVSERLWEYQLRALGPSAVRFTWGGVEVESQSLAEAVESARERMRQTRHSRKNAAAEPRPDAVKVAG